MKVAAYEFRKYRGSQVAGYMLAQWSHDMIADVTWRQPRSLVTTLYTRKAQLALAIAYK